MSKIYLDMDQVLIDFNKGLEEFNIINDTMFIHKPKSEWSKREIALDRAVVDCMNTPNFFRNLPMMVGADRLWVQAGRPYVLTAWPKTTNDRDRIRREKRESLTDYFGEVSDDRFIYCAREDKQKYATSGDYSNILVDDMQSNIQAWERAGGIGILFINSDQAVSDLKRAMND